MEPVQTLHDFTLTLLGDPAALAAFGQDPQAALAAAGLGDVTAADVQDVLPLVLDYVPVENPAMLGQVPAAGGLTSAVADGPQGAIDRLQALTAALGLPAVGGGAVPSLPVAGGLPGVGGLASGVPGLPGTSGLPHVESVPNINGVQGVPGIPMNADVPGMPSLPGVPAVPGLSGGDLSHGLDATPVAQAAGEVPHLPAPMPAGDLAAAGQPAGHLAEAVGGGAGHVSDLMGTATQNVGSLSGALSAQGVNNIAKVVTDQAQSLAHSAPEAGSERAEAMHHGTDAGVSAVHDTVSQVSDTAHQGLGLDLHAGAETPHGGGELHFSL